jgi:hypothetical protein
MESLHDAEHPGRCSAGGCMSGNILVAQDDEIEPGDLPNLKEQTRHEERGAHCPFVKWQSQPVKSRRPNRA